MENVKRSISDRKRLEFFLLENSKHLTRSDNFPSASLSGLILSFRTIHGKGYEKGIANIPSGYNSLKLSLMKSMPTGYDQEPRIVPRAEKKVKRGFMICFSEKE